MVYQREVSMEVLALGTSEKEFPDSEEEIEGVVGGV